MRREDSRREEEVCRESEWMGCFFFIVLFLLLLVGVLLL